MPRKDEHEAEDIYNKREREELIEDDEITPEEEGFMAGREGDESGVKCAECGAILADDFIEVKVKGRSHSFCCKKCAEKYRKKS